MDRNEQVHKKKVYAGDLRTGMYVVGLDRPWTEVPFEEPFEIQGFLIRTPEHLERVRGVCRYVYIDPRRGRDTQRYVAEADEEAAVPAGLYIPRIDLRRPIYPDRTTVEEELEPAREVLRDTRALYQAVMDDVRAGRRLDARSVDAAVGAMVESIIRNPDALTWLTRLKGRDEYTYSHSIAVCVLALTFGRYLGLPKDELHVLGIATLLQDIGKLRLPKDLLDKREPLTREEYERLKEHVDASVAILKGQGAFPGASIDIVHCHHERYDAGGYPRGLEGGQIGLLGSIAGIVDTYEAMTSDRPYRPARTSFEALMTLYEQRNSAFHAAVVEHLTQCIGIFPIGSFVRLNTGETGIVVSRNRVHQLKPKVIVILDPDGRRLRSSRTVDLAAQAPQEDTKPWKITQVIDPRAVGIDPAEFFV